MELALCGQHSENKFIGLDCGLMDQFIITHGQKDCVLKFDCQSLEHEIVNINQQGNFSIILSK